MKMEIRGRHVLVSAAIAAVSVMSIATLAWAAAPQYPTSLVPSGSHVADGRSLTDTTGTVDPIDTTGTVEPTETPSPDATATPGPCNPNGADHGMKLGFHKGLSNNASAAAHAMQMLRGRHQRHGNGSHNATHADMRQFGMAGGMGNHSQNR
jgi:hypothetical protein